MTKFLSLFIIFGICWAAPQRQGTERLMATEADIYFTISATNLRGELNDPDGEVDPFVKVYIGTNTTDLSNMQRIGTSETLENDNNPKWSTVFKVKHIRGTNQVIHLIVKDYDPLNADDSMGYVAIPIDDFLTRGAYATHLSNSISGITLTQTTPIYLDLTLRGIPLQDTFGDPSDLYIMCYRTDIDGHKILFHRTDTAVNTQEFSFTYVPFLNYRRGANQKLHFEVFDYDTFSPDDSLGSVDLAVDRFIASRHSAVLSLGGRATLTVSLSRNV